MKSLYLLLYVIPVSFSFLAGCSVKKNTGIHTCTIQPLRGTVTVMNTVTQKKLDGASVISSGDYVQVEEGGDALILPAQRRVVAVHDYSRLKVFFEQNRHTQSMNTAITMDFGELFLDSITPQKPHDTCSIATPNVSLVSHRGCAHIQYDRNLKLTTVSSFLDTIVLFPMSREPVVVPPCKNVTIDKDGIATGMRALMEQDIARLRQWSRSGVLNTALALCCEEKTDNAAAAAYNQPPVLQSNPVTLCIEGDTIHETILAHDPEGKAVRFELMNGPAGMTVSEQNGTLRYVAKKAGTFEIQILAEDADGNAQYIQYSLKVEAKKILNLSVPKVCRVNAPCKIQVLTPPSASSNGLRYRFDVNSDGVWDYPASHGYGREKTVTHIYPKPGTFIVTLEARTPLGKITQVSKQVTVTAPPQSRITVSPEHGTMKTMYTITLSENVQQDETTAVLIRWDLNGDGVWDYPSNGAFAAVMNVQKTWPAPGTYTVTAEIKDPLHNSYKVSTPVTVYPGVSIRQINAPDTIQVNQKIEVSATAADPDFPITEYAWDYAGTGVVNDRNAHNTTTLTYSKEGIYTLVCAVSNDKGMSASESKKVVVINNPTMVNPGTGYAGFVKEPIHFKGSGKDADNTIVSYSWDFDDNGSIDWRSDTNGIAVHAYERQGTYTARFTIRTDDSGSADALTQVTITNRPPKAFAGGDIVSKPGKKVKLQGVGKDPDNNIVQYAWDFDGDGTYDWMSNENKDIKHEFRSFSNPVFRVMDGDSAMAFDTQRIVICPPDMKTIEKKKYCIDTYEFPNKEDEPPVTALTYEEAAEACRKAGKRLCTMNEFIYACQGGDKENTYPYGKEFFPDNCNTFNNGHVHNKAAESGEFKKCVSAFETYDMSGNVAEWTATGTADSKNAAGGWWQSQAKHGRCDTYTPLQKDKKFAYVGFRCCK